MPSSQHPMGNYAPINGLNLYYEIHGSGQPLVLLPGAYMTVAALGALVPQLAETRRVIAVELQGHGHTADIERPFTYQQRMEILELACARADASQPVTTAWLVVTAEA